MKKLLCIILIFMTMLSGGCVEKKVKPSTSRKYLVYNLGESPSDLLMVNNYNVREKDLLLALFEGLVREDKNGQIVPAMAEKIDITEDKIGYTFKLRGNIYYNDGTPIKAIDFVRFFHDILLEEENVFAEQLYCIFGAKDFSLGKAGFDKVAIMAKDDSTLEIRLNNPNNYFLNILSNPVFTLRENSMNTRDWKNNYRAIQYSGPFIIKDISEDEEIFLCKNEKYWRAYEIVSREILFTSIKDEEKSLANFETTEDSNTSKIDVLVSPPISEGISLSTEKKTITIPSQTMYYLTFNLNTIGSVEENNFRKAISVVISKEFIIQTISKDLAVPAINYTPYPEIDDNGSKLIFGAYGNKNKGLEYLKNTKYDNKQELIMVYEKQSLDSKICKEIAKNIKDYLDINVICTGYKKDELKEVLIKGNYNIVFSRIDEAYGDIYKFFTRWTSNSKDNIYGYKNLDYDKIIENALMEKNEKNKIIIYNEAQEVLAKDLPCIPVYIVNTVICKKENIKDIYTTKSGNLIFDYAYKDNAMGTK